MITSTRPKAFAMHLRITWGETEVLDAKASCTMTRDILLGLCDNFASDTKAQAVNTLPSLGDLLALLTGELRRYVIGDDTGMMIIEIQSL